MERMKTEAELVKEFGADWRDGLNFIWTPDMDSILGKPVGELLDEGLPQSAVSYNLPNTISISWDMITSDPLPPGPLTRDDVDLLLTMLKEVADEGEIQN